MNRKAERIIIRIGGVWNILNGSLTLFFISPWIKNRLFEDLSGDTKGLNFLSENLNSFIVIYCLLYIFLGVFNLYLSTRLEDESSSKGIPVWLLFIGLIGFMLVDVVSAVSYISAAVFSLSKNKAMKIKFG